MADYRSKITDKAIADTEKQLRAIYTKAGKELRKKLEEYTDRFQRLDAEKRAALEAGEITKAAYDQWKRGQVFIGKQWQKKVEQAAEILHHANEEAALLVGANRMNVFAENYNFTAFMIEKQGRGAVSFNLFNDRSAARLIREKPKMLPEWKIDQPKDYKWNRKKVENTITQGIIQGKSIREMTGDLVENLCTTNDKRMNLFARTAMTGAQNAGKQTLMEDAEEEGIELVKKWVATLDSRTRDLHQELDGQEVPVDQPFTVDLNGQHYEIDYPGDPNADPEMCYNCRCTMVEVFKGVSRKATRRAYYDEDEQRERDIDRAKREGKQKVTTHRESYMVQDMTYKEWKKWKEGRK